jgi:hypothetical protein
MDFQATCLRAAELLREWLSERLYAAKRDRGLLVRRQDAAEIESLATALEGYWEVPREPTEAMLAAAANSVSAVSQWPGSKRVATFWKAMHDAAPDASTSTGKAGDIGRSNGLPGEASTANDEALPRPEIVTEFVYPPIPIRTFDWSAVRDGYEGGDLIGRGATEAEAIADLLELEAET